MDPVEHYLRDYLSELSKQYFLRMRFWTIRLTLPVALNSEVEGFVTIPEGYPFCWFDNAFSSVRDYDGRIVSVTSLGTDQNLWISQPTRLDCVCQSGVAGAPTLKHVPSQVQKNEVIRIRLRRDWALDILEAYPGVLQNSLIDFTCIGADMIPRGKKAE